MSTVVAEQWLDFGQALALCIELVQAIPEKRFSNSRGIVDSQAIEFARIVEQELRSLAQQLPSIEAERSRAAEEKEREVVGLLRDAFPDLSTGGLEFLILQLRQKLDRAHSNSDGLLKERDKIIKRQEQCRQLLKQALDLA